MAITIFVEGVALEIVEIGDTIDPRHNNSLIEAFSKIIQKLKARGFTD